MKNPTIEAPAIFTYVLYICSLVLFLEWLYPVNQITDTSNLGVFILFTLFCFLISALHVNWLLSFLAKGIGLLFVINRLFFDTSILDVVWLNNLWTDLSTNMGFLISRDWYHLTPLFRSLLFLILIWLMSYLLYYWFVTMKYVFVFVLLTICYVGLLDTFTAYNAHFAIIRIVIISFISLGLTNLMKEQAREGIYFPKRSKRMFWVLPIVVITFLSVALGYFGPKFAPQWPDPVPFLESVADKSDGFGFTPTTRTVGYGEDDSELGGSFAQDDTAVFEAEVAEKQYWRIETKDVYTGSGWKRSEETSFEKEDEGNISLETFTNEVETEARVADVTFSGQVALNKVVYPYGIRDVYHDGDADFWLDTSSESIHSRLEGKKVSLPSYTLSYEQPSFDVDILKNGSESDPERVIERYTQLPDDLPERVGELAEEITEPYSKRYYKVKAVEQYFNRNGFVYQISNVPVPDDGEDYVDQFLYDTKAGYCDNYSTSMAVMLRTLDIPTRWVKGFTGGDKVDEKEGPNGNTRGVYEVTNANAHSWVEVYFPGIGWVPFEPTQGFSNEADFYEEGNDGEDILDSSENEQNETSNEPDEEQPDNKENTTENEKEPANKDTASIFPYWYVLLVLVLLLALIWVVYYKRFHIRAYLLRRKLLQQKVDTETYSQTYLFLLRLLKHKGLKKGSEQTLREFASRIDKRYGGNDMKRITAYYEQMVYNKKITHVPMDDFKELWERLVKKIVGKNK